jgi:hypothetical protein
VCVAAVAGLNLYDVLQPCYHGRNPYRSAAELGAALATYRRWPALGGLRNGPVAGWVELLGQLGHTPPCLDSRWGWGEGAGPTGSRPAASVLGLLACWATRAAGGACRPPLRLFLSPQPLHREMWAFANDPAVRQAIHAEPIDKIGAFDECERSGAAAPCCCRRGRSRGWLPLRGMPAALLPANTFDSADSCSAGPPTIARCPGAAQAPTARASATPMTPAPCCPCTAT